MLVLSRKPQESIVVHGDASEGLEIIVLGIDRGRVKLGFRAGRRLEIRRGELAPPPEIDRRADDDIGHAHAAALDQRSARLRSAL